MIDLSTVTPSTGTLGAAVENRDPVYPYGTRITLDGETLRKLGASESTLPPVGSRFKLIAIVEVVSQSKHEDVTENNLSLELQMQQMELKPVDERNEQQRAYDQVSRLYG